VLDLVSVAGSLFICLNHGEFIVRTKSSRRDHSGIDQISAQRRKAMLSPSVGITKEIMS
jgi:hypothetical protein